MDLNQNFTSLDAAALVAYAAEVRTAFDALVEIENPTIEQITEAEGLAEHLEAITDHQEAQVAAEEDRVNRAAALRERFSTAPGEGDPDPHADEDEDGDEEGDGDEADEADAPQAEAPAEAAVVPAARAAVATLARRTARPARPSTPPVTITAAADVPEFATGSRIETMDVVGKALVNRMRGFSAPTGNGETENLQMYGVASFALTFPEDLTVDRHSDDMEILTRAADEHRLPGKTLVAEYALEARVPLIIVSASGRGCRMVRPVGDHLRPVSRRLHRRDPVAAGDQRRQGWHQVHQGSRLLRALLGGLLPDRGAGDRRNHEALLRGALPAVRGGPSRRLWYLHQGPDPHQRGLPRTGVGHDQ